jgi:protoheme IX farnesyltransferase
MMPVVHGKATTRLQILLYALVLYPVGLLPGAIGLAGPLYMAAAVLFGAWLVWDAAAVWREKDEAHEPAARRLFPVSILYLFVLFAALIAERLLGIAPLGHATFGAWM